MADLKNIDWNVASTIRDDDFFGTLSDSDKQTLFAAMTTKQYKTGDVLIKEGDEQTKMLIVTAGKIEKRKGARSSFLKRGDISGVLHFFARDPSYATLTAAEDSTVSEIDSDHFKTLLSANPSLNTAFITFLSKLVRSRSNLINSIRASVLGSGGIRIAFFDSKAYMKEAFEQINQKFGFEFVWIKEKLSEKTVAFATGCSVVCCFVNDTVNDKVISHLAETGVGLIAMRCAGYDNVDLKLATKLGLSVTRVPAYSPYAVAEHAAALMLSLNRHLHLAYVRTRDHNFSLNGLVGFDMHGKTVGVLGTGKIGKCLVYILRGFGCNVLCYDVREDPELATMQGVKYVTKDELLAQSDIVSLHAPLLPSTKHTINAEALGKMKNTALLINTSRGGLVDSEALLDAVMTGKIAGAGLDVYEGEKAYFFENQSDKNMTDSTLSRLLACKNVLITSHQAFLTQEALQNIADSTLQSVKDFSAGKRGKDLPNAVYEEYK